MTRDHAQTVVSDPMAEPASGSHAGKDADGARALPPRDHVAAARFEGDAYARWSSGSRAPSKIYPLAKRCLDLLVAPVAILLTAPVVLLALVASALSTRSWPLMTQTRVGQYGRTFKMYKIRTMRRNAQLPPGSARKLPDDPRVTRMGRLLRKTSIDELPQFWNVVIGNMTLVGPRPALPEVVAGYEPWQHERHVVPPGMTGWWQILWRSEKPLDQATEDDIYYVRNRCLRLDLQILWRTLGAVFRGRGAY